MQYFWYFTSTLAHYGTDDMVRQMQLMISINV